jgi:hypothetical protein
MIGAALVSQIRARSPQELRTARWTQHFQSLTCCRSPVRMSAMGSITAVAAAVTLPPLWTEIRPHGLGTPASTLTWGAVRQSHVYSTGFTLAGLGRMQRFAHRWRQHRRICCGATVEHQHRHIVCVASAFPTDGQLAQQAHRDRASSRSRRSVATFCHHPARSVLCRRPPPSPLDARQIQVHEAALLPELQMKAWEKLAQSVSAKFSWARLVLTRRTVTVASPPGRDLGLSSRACR